MGHKSLEENLPLSEIAKKYACEKHKYVNQSYDMYPYSYHLDMVYQIGLRFIHLIPEDEREEVLAGCWVHDMIEDTRETYNNIKRILGETIAEYSYRCANEKGRVRAERANEKYYKEIKEYKHTSFIKICDRIANIIYSKRTGSSMFDKYKKENDHFFNSLYNEKYNDLWILLFNIINE
jgi:(p)ppGpp synthase/HD superfamily hydrolase